MFCFLALALVQNSSISLFPFYLPQSCVYKTYFFTSTSPDHHHHHLLFPKIKTLNPPNSPRVSLHNHPNFITMYNNFKEQVIELVKQAVQEDNAGNYAKPFPLYMNALEYFNTHLNTRKKPKIREAITQKFIEYLRHAEEIRVVLDDGGARPAGNDGDAAVAARPKTKSNVEGEMKPNVKWSDVAGLESAKQALHEAVILPVKFPQFFTGVAGTGYSVC
ncbi:putative vesicle-fusing ATPase [Helianthus anomalus]